MPQSLVKIWVHIIFSTKHREALILPKYEKGTYQHMREKLLTLKCEVLALNGMSDHVHILIRLPSVKSIADVVRDCKGETAFWFNDKHQPEHALYWQDGYAAFSVSGSLLPEVKKYIDNQKIIHKQRTLAEELEMIRKRFRG